jgi:hypothetical protein
MVATSTGIRVPNTSADTCGHRSPRSLKPCTRATGHGGRHHFAWRHLDGRVREVWEADCQVCQRPTTDGAVCRECGAA